MAESVIISVPLLRAGPDPRPAMFRGMVTVTAVAPVSRANARLGIWLPGPDHAVRASLMELNSDQAGIGSSMASGHSSGDLLELHGVGEF